MDYEPPTRDLPERKDVNVSEQAFPLRYGVKEAQELTGTYTCDYQEPSTNYLLVSQ